MRRGPNMCSKPAEHISVLSEEVLQYFSDMRLRTFYDGTLGAGGHARTILEAHPEIERYIGCDRDPEALAIARENLKAWKGKVDFIHGNFADLDSHLREKGISVVDGFFLT